MPGNRLENFDPLISAVPIKFDYKGNYGVAIVWNDGHFADIYPYKILKYIAESFEVK